MTLQTVSIWWLVYSVIGAAVALANYIWDERTHWLYSENYLFVGLLWPLVVLVAAVALVLRVTTKERKAGWQDEGYL